MIFLLFVAPIFAQTCVFNVGGKNIDLSYLTITKQNYFYHHSEWGDFNIRLCDDLIQDGTLPSCVQNTIGWAGVGVTNGKCYQTAATDSFVVKKISESQFTITYGSDTDSEPTSIDQVQTTHLFQCVDSNTSIDPININIDDINKNRILTLTYQIICNFVPATPSPTPAVDMSFSKESQTQSGLGILFNLNELGDMDREIAYSDDNYQFVFSPGKYVNCPFPYNCQHETNSSLYVCHTGKIMNGANIISEPKGYCSSFAVPNSQMAFSQNGISEDQGVKVHYTDSNNKRTADIYFKCDTSKPLHEISLDGKPNGDDAHVEFTVRTPDTCIRAPTPVPDPLHRYCTYQPSGYSSPIFDLFRLNQDAVSGINGVVYNEETGVVIENHLMFFIQPCGSIECPSGYSCSSNDEIQKSSFWKCSSTTKQCMSVANVTTGNLVFENINNKLVGRFGSTLFGKKNAEMFFTCNPNEKSLGVDPNVYYNTKDDVYRITLINEAFCWNQNDSSNSLSGGAIFLIVLLVVVVLYIAIGMIYIYVRNGSLGFPNKNFWMEFGLCIREACIYIFTCNRRNADNLMKSTYDKI